MKYAIEGATLTDIADAIRAKAGTSGAIDVCDMPDAIMSITGGSTGGPSVPDEPDGKNYLFKNVDFPSGEAAYNEEFNLYEPVPDIGTTYYASLNGVDFGSGVCEDWGEPDFGVAIGDTNGAYIAYDNYYGWSFGYHSTVQSGKVSIWTMGASGGNSGGTDGNWLFKKELIDGFRTDLPRPVPDTSHTFFFEDEEIGTSTADADGRITFGDSGTSACLLYNDYDGVMQWFFHPVDSMASIGHVSVRINKASSKGWTLASDGMGMVRIENGYLYADADPMYLEDEEGNTVEHFDQTSPLDLSELDKNKVYTAWSDVGGGAATALFYKETEDEWVLDFVSEDYNTLYFANGYLRSYEMSYYLNEDSNKYIDPYTSLNLSVLDTSTRYTILNDGDSSEVAKLYYIG